MTNPNLPRRDFMKKTAAFGAGIQFLSSGSLFGANRPGNKLNIALIGCWGRASAHIETLKKENVVALCDVNSRALAYTAQTFPKAKQYKDWRKCLDQKDLDAVVICTPDHHHAFIATWAMNRGLHVYGEKPLGNSVEEVRTVRETYLKNRNKIATQCGTQRHADPNFARIRELIQDGAIGELRDVHAWGDRWHDKTGYYSAEGGAPDYIDWDLWVGPSPMHPFHPGYFTSPIERRGETQTYMDPDPSKWPTGSNCLAWNMYRDFGNWQIGDMGSHTMDLAFAPLDADLPISAVADGEPYNPEVAPSRMYSSCVNPANDWRGEIRVTWHQGGEIPKSPISYIDLSKIGHGAMFKGDKGFLICDFKTRMVIPYGKAADMTYFEPRKESELIPDVGNFQEEWTNACKGDLKTTCNFDYSGVLIEQLLLGMVAYDVGKKLDYDPANMRVKNSPEANRLLKKAYRKGWVLNG